MRTSHATMLVAGVLSTALGAASFTAPGASADEFVTVNQGDRFYFKLAEGSDPSEPDTMSYCTIGQVDKSARTALTAGHCGRGYTNEIFLESGSGLTRAGTITKHENFIDRPNSLGDKFAYDQATINFGINVTVGNNVYTGDATTSPADVTMGDEVCFHGGNTHAGTRRYSCAPYMGSVDGMIIVAAKLNRGDSGGPIWVPNKGLLGTASLSADVQVTDGEDFPITIGTSLTPSTSLFSESAFDALVKDYVASVGKTGHVQRVNTRDLPAEPATEVKDLSNVSSSTIGITVGAFAAVIALIAVLAPFAARLNA